LRDPVAIPIVPRRLVGAELRGEAVEHAQIVDRVDIGGDDQRLRQYPRARQRIARHERRFGPGGVEIVDDRETLADHRTRYRHRRHQSLRVVDAKRLATLFASR
jgi:hypothetical protein